MADFTSGLQWAEKAVKKHGHVRGVHAFFKLWGQPAVENQWRVKSTRNGQNPFQPAARSDHPLLRKFTEDERKRRRSFERKDNSVPLAGSVKYIAPGTSWSVQFHFREKGKVVNFSCFGREFMENLCLLMNIPLINLY